MLGFQHYTDPVPHQLAVHWHSGKYVTSPGTLLLYVTMLCFTRVHLALCDYIMHCVFM